MALVMKEVEDVGQEILRYLENVVLIQIKNKIYDKIVELKNVESEKYGRLLADIYLGDENINEWLITQNFAVKYDGGTKQKPESWFI